MLANYADNSATCYPSLGRLSEDCGMSQSQVRKCVVKLEKHGLVRRHMRVRAYGQTSNIYEMDLSVTVTFPPKPPPPLIECRGASMECHKLPTLTYHYIPNNNPTKGILGNSYNNYIRTREARTWQ